jgi:hypothetical protein
MTDFATDRLEPSSRGVPVSGQEPRELPGKVLRRPKVKPPSQKSSEKENELQERVDPLPHRIDQLA